MTAIASPCPECSAVVDVLEPLEDVAGPRRDGVRVARPCGHLVAVVNVLPRGGVVLGSPPVVDQPAAADPPAGVDVPDDLSGMAGAGEDPAVRVTRRVQLTQRLLETMPGVGPLPMQLVGPILTALAQAQVDAEVLGTGWIRLSTPAAGARPMIERVDPALVVLLEVPSS